MSENKENVLADFQVITGIDDVGEAFSHLEETNWNLRAAIERVIPLEDAAPRGHDVPPPTFAASASNFATSQNNFNVNAGSSSNFNRWNSNNTSTSNLMASTSADAEIIDLTSDIDLDSSRHDSGVETLTFNIHYNHNVYTIRMPSSANIDQLKIKIAEATNVPMCRQAIRGWPPAKVHEAQIATSLLRDLDLSQENYLILNNLAEEGYVATGNDEIERRLTENFKLTIVEQPNGKTVTLNLLGSTTIEEVKQNVFDVFDIPARHQEWEGWPMHCDNSVTLAQSGIGLSHNFTLRNAARRVNNSSNSSNNTISAATLGIDNDSSTDEHDDDYQDTQDDECFTYSRVKPPIRHLIPDNINDELSGSVEFISNYQQSFGEPYPPFLPGTLEDAIKLACHKPARERKLLAIYLHHGNSILTNVFCEHLMKHETIRQMFQDKFVLYGWDLTFDSNKDMFLSSVTAHVSSAASQSVRHIQTDKLPAIMIIGKSRLSGVTSCEVLSVIHGNVGLDDLLSRLMDAVEMYGEQLQGEIRDEDERAARDQVKAEQDMAYQATLQADMAKEEAKRQQEAALAAERQRIESIEAEEKAKRESIRLVAEQSLPAEPSATETDVLKIRVQERPGKYVERRFYPHNTLQDLLNFATANGYLIEKCKLILISSSPRRDLTDIDPNQTLKSLNFHSQEKVIVEDR